MPTLRTVVKKITAWSYSRWTDYVKCPFLSKLKAIDKLREPSNKALDKGRRVHAMAATLALGKVPPLSKDDAELKPMLEGLLKKGAKFPVELETFEAEFCEIRTKIKNAQVECEWAFDRDWNRVDWFAPSAWLRIKVDLHWLVEKKKGVQRETRVEIVDHKTGRWSSEHAEQRELYALGALLVYPDAVVVRARHWYLDAGKEEGFSVAWGPQDLDNLKQRWLNRTTAMLNDTTFAPKAGPYCRWCHFRKANGGPCEF